MAHTYIWESIGTSFDWVDPVVEDLTRLPSDRPLPDLDANFEPSIEYKILNPIVEFAGAIRNWCIKVKDWVTNLLNL